MAEYIITMDLTFRSTVTIMAESENDALAKAKEWQVDDDGMAGAELVDWQTIGSTPRKVLDFGERP